MQVAVKVISISLTDIGLKYYTPEEVFVNSFLSSCGAFFVDHHYGLNGLELKKYYPTNYFTIPTDLFQPRSVSLVIKFSVPMFLSHFRDSKDSLNPGRDR